VKDAFYIHIRNHNDNHHGKLICITTITFTFSRRLSLLSVSVMLPPSTLAILLLLLSGEMSGFPSDLSSHNDAHYNLNQRKSDNVSVIGDKDLIDTDASYIDNQTKLQDNNHPLLTVMETKPHSMSLMVKTRDYLPETMLRLLYERVPVHRQPVMQQLDDPVIEYIPLTRRVQSHDLTELPMGKYIVCGEAMVQGEVYQANCFETCIERLDNNSKDCEG